MQAATHRFLSGSTRHRLVAFQGSPEDIGERLEVAAAIFAVVYAATDPTCTQMAVQVSSRFAISFQKAGEGVEGNSLGGFYVLLLNGAF